jgi:hypothetical protein
MIHGAAPGRLTRCCSGDGVLPHMHSSPLSVLLFIASTVLISLTKQQGGNIGAEETATHKVNTDVEGQDDEDSG